MQTAKSPIPRSSQQAINSLSPGDRRVLNENELAQRWGVSPKTLQRWRSEERGPPYIKLSKAIRYPVDEIVTYEQAIRQGMSNEAPLPSLCDAQPVVESPAPAAPAQRVQICSMALSKR